MKRHMGIVFFYALCSFILVEIFFVYSHGIDLFILFAIVAMVMGWMLHIAPPIRIRLLLWTLVFGVGLCIFVFQEISARIKYASARMPPSWYPKEYTMGYYHERNISVRNYSIERKRAIEERKQYNERMKNYKSTSGSSGSSYSGGSSHYGGGLSGGK